MTAAVVGINGECIARIATTHFSEMRAEMPSGMGPLRELESRLRPLHPGRYMYMPGYSQPPYTLHALLMHQRQVRWGAPGAHQCQQRWATTGNASHTWPPLTAAR
jgi:hypothetical protein